MTARRDSSAADRATTPAPACDESRRRLLGLKRSAPRPKQVPLRVLPSEEKPRSTSRRDFVKLSGACAAAVAVSGTAAASSGPHLDHDRVGVLVDLTVCIGCRRCEWACAKDNELPHGSLDSYDDTSVFEQRRYPTSKRLTVVNQAPAKHDDGSPIHFKSQCMHCEHPPCASACIVGALRKDPGGPVTYDASKCIGCRYCIVACPFQMPAYEYENALTPEVRKCTLCKERTKDGGMPACVSICPVEALTYGPREELVALAHERIRKHPDRYVNHVYGEHEAGGTSWLYLSDRPFQELGFPTLGPDSPAEVTETIQHGIFKGFAAPLLLGGLLAAISKLSRDRTGA